MAETEYIYMIFEQADFLHWDQKLFTGEHPTLEAQGFTVIGKTSEEAWVRGKAAAFEANWSASGTVSRLVPAVVQTPVSVLEKAVPKKQWPPTGREVVKQYQQILLSEDLREQLLMACMDHLEYVLDEYDVGRHYPATTLADALHAVGLIRDPSEGSKKHVEGE